MSESLNFYIGSALEAINRIERSVKHASEKEFLADDLHVDAASTNLMRVNVAYKMISEHYPNFPLSHPELDWAGVVEISTKLIDDCMDIDSGWLWTMAAVIMPVQKQKLIKVYGRGDDYNQ